MPLYETSEKKGSLGLSPSARRRDKNFAAVQLRRRKSHYGALPQRKHNKSEETRLF